MVEELRHAIESGRLPFGRRLRPLREMARHYGISVPTAQRAMARLEGAGLVRRRQGAGVFVSYQRAQTEVAEVVGATVMMLVSHHGQTFNRFAARLSEGVTDHGLQPVHPAWDQAQIEAAIPAWLNTWRAQPPRAVVIQRSAPGLVEALERLCAGRSLVVEVFRLPTDRTPFHRVNPDYATACEVAVGHFLARGHKRIGFTTHRRSIRPAADGRYQKRWTGHTHQILELGRALREAGVRRHGLTILYNHNPKNPKHSPSPASHEGNAALHPDNIERAMRWLSGPNRPTAVFGDDSRIAGVIRAAERLGMRIGEDLDVLGQGNTEWSEALNFPSIEFEPELVADEVMTLIRRSASGPLPSRHEIAVPVRLVER